MKNKLRIIFTFYLLLLSQHQAEVIELQINEKTLGDIESIRMNVILYDAIYSTLDGQKNIKIDNFKPKKEADTNRGRMIYRILFGDEYSPELIKILIENIATIVYESHFELSEKLRKPEGIIYKNLIDQIKEEKNLNRRIFIGDILPIKHVPLKDMAKNNIFFVRWPAKEPVQ